MKKIETLRTTLFDSIFISPFAGLVLLSCIAIWEENLSVFFDLWWFIIFLPILMYVNQLGMYHKIDYEKREVLIRCGFYQILFHQNTVKEVRQNKIRTTIVYLENGFLKEYCLTDLFYTQKNFNKTIDAILSFNPNAVLKYEKTGIESIDSGGS